MIFGSILFVGLSLIPAQTPNALPSQQQRPCAQALAEAVTDGAASEICAGDDAVRLANAAPRDSAEKTRQLEAAAEHYRKAASVASKPTTKILALNQLVSSYDTQRLNDPKQMEVVLREVIALTPDDLAPVYRLARVQEDEGFIDAAEETLLDARHKQPDTVEPNRMLAQFYARRVTALHKQEAQKESTPTSNPGEPDANGVYLVGGSITPPARDGIPRYPVEAQAAGIKGVVVAEVVIDPSGNVTDAKVVQSIPLLDDEALRAVRNWHFAPTMVNGQPVLVRMNVNVNFSLPPTSAPPRQ
jgi:TonB family protein